MNAAVRWLGWAAIRRRWRGVVFLALLGGLAGTVVLGAAAGARRTSSALSRFQAASRAADVEVNVGTAGDAQLREFAATPQVLAVGRIHQFPLIISAFDFLPTAAAVDEGFGSVVDRARVVRGRLADNRAPDEIVIGEALVRRLRVDVGSTLTFATFSPDQGRVAATGRDPGEPRGPRVSLRVVGVVRRPLDLAARGAVGGVIVMTPAFYEKYSGKIGSSSGDILRVRTRNGAADLPAVLASARRIFGNNDVFDVQSLGVESEGARDAIKVLAFALWIFAVIAGLAGAVSVTIVARRQIAAEQADQPLLSSLGFTRPERTIVAACPAVPMAAAAAVIAAIGAIACSALFPFGIARRADPDVGVHVDWLVVGLGASAIAVFVIAGGAYSAFRVASGARDPAERMPPSTRRALGTIVAQGSRLNPSGKIGIAFALDPERGRRSIPARSAIAGAVLGAAGVTAALVFTASFAHLVDTPRLFGWSFDAVVLPTAADDPTPRTPTVCGDVEAPVIRDRAFSAVGAVCTVNVEVDGRPATAWSFTSLRGTIEPTIVTGRPPAGDDEIALGATTMRALHKNIGDSVAISGDPANRPFRIVGQVALPSPAAIDPQALADGAVVTGSAMYQFRAAQSDSANTDFHFVARLRSGVTLAGLPRDRETGLAQVKSGGALGTVIPVEIERIRSVRRLPAVLGGFLALLASISIAHTLLVAGRLRRHDLAVLRVLGFTRRQVRATIAWQATTIGIAGLVVGVPIGLIIGNLVWRNVADGLGVAAVTIRTPLALCGLATAAIVLVNVIGALAARRAVRVRPGAALRAE